MLKRFRPPPPPRPQARVPSSTSNKKERKAKRGCSKDLLPYRFVPAPCRLCRQPRVRKNAVCDLQVETSMATRSAQSEYIVSGARCVLCVAELHFNLFKIDFVKFSSVIGSLSVHRPVRLMCLPSLSSFCPT